jgi:hypothetical protein
MTIATSGGTEVTLLCDAVPSGIQPSDHRTGLTSTLKKLAAFIEQGAASSGRWVQGLK